MKVRFGVGQGNEKAQGHWITKEKRRINNVLHPLSLSTSNIRIQRSLEELFFLLKSHIYPSPETHTHAHSSFLI